MSGIGHLAAGFAAQPAAPRIPIWVLLAAAEANEILYFLFTLTGLEQKAVMTMNFREGVRYLTSASNPWSHGLFMSVVWSLAATAIGCLIYKERRSGLLLGAVVFSHWLLDFLMHSNLPLFFEGSPRVGLGLENSGAGFMFISLFDLVILAAGLLLYFRAKKGSTPGAKTDER
jgi:membrane-bound metal-dependent hydrolase YbcI (DUF457 family)